MSEIRYKWVRYIEILQSEGSGKPLFCVLFYKKTGCRGERESKVSLNPKCLALAIPINGDMSRI